MLSVNTYNSARNIFLLFDDGEMWKGNTQMSGVILITFHRSEWKHIHTRAVLSFVVIPGDITATIPVQLVAHHSRIQTFNAFTETPYERGMHVSFGWCVGVRVDL